MFRLLLLAVAVLCSVAAEAREPSFVDPKVIDVQTIGRWQTAAASGRYKVVVTTEGWEHVWSRVYVEWLPDPTNQDTEWKITARSELETTFPQGTAILEAKAEPSGTNKLVVTIQATPNQDFSEYGVKKGVFRFEATTPGVVRALGHMPAR